MTKQSRRIHIVSLSPRTGTTLLAETMATCFHIDRKEPHEGSCARLKWTKGIYLTKWPGELDTIAPRMACDERFWVICLIRDPRDVIVSRHEKNPDRYWAPLRFWKNAFGLLQHHKTHPHFVIVRYEDLVSAPDAVQIYIESKLPFLQRKAKFSQFHELAEPSVESVKALGHVRPISISSIGRWKSHLPRIAGQIEQHGSITSELIDLGYEQNSNWEEVLGEIEPDLAKSHHAENRNQPILHKTWRRFRRAYLPAAIGGLCSRFQIPLI